MVVERGPNMCDQQNCHENSDPQMRRQEPIGKLTVFPPYLRHFEQTEEGHGSWIRGRSDPSDHGLYDQQRIKRPMNAASAKALERGNYPAARQVLDASIAKQDE